MHDAKTTERFIRLLSENERRLYGYAMSLTADPVDADDVLQEAKVVMWRHFGTFQPGTNFGAWSRRCVFNQVLAHRKRRSRERKRLTFSDEFLETVAAESETISDHLEARRQTLRACIQKLPSDQRELVEQRYHEEEEIETIADTVGRTVGAVYRALSRIRRTLFECVNRQTTTGL